MPNSERVEGRHITMSPSDWYIVEQVSDQLALDNVSAAARYIIRDWNRRITEEASPLFPVLTTTLEVTP